MKKNTKQLELALVAMKAELQSTIAKLDMLSNSVLGGVAKLSIDDNLRILTASEGYYIMTGYSEAEIQEKPIYGCAVNLVHPNDLQSISGIIEKIILENKPVSISYRIIKKDGSVAWNRAYCAKVETTNNQRTIDVFFMDTTIEYNQRLESSLNLERYRIITDLTCDMVYEWNTKTDIIHFSPVFEQFFGFQPSENTLMSSLANKDFVFEEDKVIIYNMMKDVISGKSNIETEFRLKAIDGHYIWCRNRATVIFDDAHNPLSAVGILTNIDDYKKTINDLLIRAERDSLTGLLNRKTAQYRIEQSLLANREKVGHFSAFILLDIDNFKKTNDLMGHGIGDSVLVNVAKSISEITRATDVVSRFGGDEFVVFLTNLPSAEIAKDIAKKIIKTIKVECDLKNYEFPVTVSLGISISPQDGIIFCELYRRADGAMYKAKKLGGDCFVTY